MSTTHYVPATSLIDPTAPGGVEEMLAFHRTVFGDAVMEATGEAPPAAAPPAPVPAPPPQVPTAPAPQATAEPAPGGETLPDDPTALKAEIARLRRENAATRTNAKTTAADEARQELAREVGKALGLVTDEAPDPAKLTEQVTAAQTQARQAAVELAVYKAAGAHQGDPAALLDSRTFLAKVTDLDPAAADFQTQVDAAIKEAVTTNPKLKTAPVAGASSVDHAGGTGENGTKPTTLAGAISAHYGTP